MELKIANLDQILKSRVRVNYRHRLDVDHNDFQKIKEWCEHHCKGDWNSVNSKFACYIQFEHDQDFTFCSLRWK